MHFAGVHTIARLGRTEQKCPVTPRAGHRCAGIGEHPVDPQRVLPGVLRLRRASPVAGHTTLRARSLIGRTPLVLDGEVVELPALASAIGPPAPLGARPTVGEEARYIRLTAMRVLPSHALLTRDWSCRIAQR
ncbi:MAG: hypothetical protein AMS20_10930 [Gemmatimonas sp. SG8_28]|nr:MAG: hypothetical protein AMS20_10930 [Gemmatimonas sp. SG8_28]